MNRRKQARRAPEMFHYKTAFERVRFLTLKINEISETLLTHCATDLQRIHVALLWAEQLGRRRERTIAQYYSGLAREIMTPETPARLQRRIAACLTYC